MDMFSEYQRQIEKTTRDDSDDGISIIPILMYTVQPVPYPHPELQDSSTSTFAYSNVHQ